MYSGNHHYVRFIVIDDVAAPFAGDTSAIVSMPPGSIPLVGDMVDVQCTDGGILRDMIIIGRKFDLVTNPFSCDLFVCPEIALHNHVHEDDEGDFK